jgi:hypothetical protein
MQPKSTLNVGRVDFRCDLKTDVDFVPHGWTYDAKNEKHFPESQSE